MPYCVYQHDYSVLLRTTVDYRGQLDEKPFTIPITITVRSLQIIVCVATKIHRGTSAGINSYRPMTTVARDIEDNNIKIAIRTGDNIANTMPESI